MGFPWVRLDSNIGSHDKVLALLDDPSSKKWQAFSSYICSLGWSGGQGTDGLIPRSALPFVHGTATTARLLEKYRLWHEAPGGYRIVNYDKRQATSAAAESARADKQRASAKGNCVRHHGASCGCWESST